MKRGFTLVELAIVLVIIGLVIGGILVAQSMMSAAKIQRFVGQINSFDIAVANFRTKYNSLPGDSKILSPAGDGDGIIEDSDLNTLAYPFSVLFDYEESNFWRHLSIAGFTPDNVIYSNTATSGIKVGTNTPNTPMAVLGRARYGKGAGIVIHNAVSNRPEYFISDNSQSTTTQYLNTPNGFDNAFTPLEVLAVDMKMDDGTTGGFMFGWHDSSFPNTCYNGSGIYLKNNNVECLIRIQILGSQGGIN